ncbi:unnamed protein product, partial [Brassica rapa subsp. trilocularis]
IVRSIKWNQEDALVARRFKQELAPSMGSMDWLEWSTTGLLQLERKSKQGCVSGQLKGQIHKLSSPYFPSSNQAHTNS